MTEVYPVPAENALLYEEVAEKIAKLIRDGVLRPGDRLPSLRRTSQQHHISIGTAVQAYLTLENRGLIDARPKSGYFVRYQPRLLEPEPSRPRPSATAVGVGEL